MYSVGAHLQGDIWLETDLLQDVDQYLVLLSPNWVLMFQLSFYVENSEGFIILDPVILSLPPVSETNMGLSFNLELLIDLQLLSDDIISLNLNN